MSGGGTVKSYSAQNLEAADKWYTCCVCCKQVSPLDATPLRLCGRNTLCGKTCAQVFVQYASFVQGFVLGKVLSVFQVDVKPLDHPEQEPDVKFEPHSENDTFSMQSVNTDLPLSVFAHALSPHTDSTSVPLVHADVSASASVSSNNSETQQSRQPRHLRSSKQSTCETGKSSGQLNSGPVSGQCVAGSYRTGRSCRQKLLSVSAIGCVEKQRDQNLVTQNETEGKRKRSTCLHCGAEFSSARALRSHTKRKHKKDVKLCRICGKGCSGQVGLTLHMYNRHKGEKANECNVCSERFPYAADLDRHMTLVHGQERGICHICGKHFRYRHTLKAHIKAHSGIRGFVCELCGKGFLRHNNLLTHKNTVHFCRVCKRRLSSSQCPNHPRPTVREILKKPKSAAAETLSVLHCRECNTNLENVELFEAHRREHRLQHQRPHHCQVCGKRFKTSAGLSAHAQQHKEKRFQCDLCQKTFTYKCNMETHRKIHVEGRPFECEFCNKKFKTEIVLQRHKAAHIEQRQYKCYVCGKGLTRLDTYKRHLVKIHPGAETLN
ncbi:hypothetical protein BaRGS_00014970 [Batillaria attramentaria]|uniref:C2H2-type domain-containing protein n=1 Tax=Batillaria attramentaria TaxID=370345 RepID=A0ABD0L2R3_9CAEN